MSILTVNPEFIHWYKRNKLFIVSLLVVLVFITLLDVGRLTPTTDSMQKKILMNRVESLMLPELSREDFTLIESSYKNFEQKKELKQTGQTQLMSAVEQEKQQGELVSLFVGDNKLKLKAVVSYNTQSVSYNTQSENKAVEHSYYALIEVANLIKGERVVQKYQHKDDVFGYQLIIKQNKQVQLVAQNDELKRIINLVMYQKSNKASEKAKEQALSNQNNIKKSSE